MEEKPNNSKEKLSHHEIWLSGLKKDLKRPKTWREELKNPAVIILFIYFIGCAILIFFGHLSYLGNK